MLFATFDVGRDDGLGSQINPRASLPRESATLYLGAAMAWKDEESRWK